MEFLFEVILELFGELLLSGFVSLLDPAKPITAWRMVLQAIGYAGVGLLIGMTTIVIAPEHVLQDPNLRVTWLAVAPLVGGIGFSAGKWLAGRRTRLVTLHAWPFVFGALLVGTLNAVRFVAAR